MGPQVGAGPVGLVEVDLGPGVRAALTTAPRNVAPGLGEDDDVVRRRRRALAAELGAPVLFARQVHGAAVHEVGTATAVPDDPLAVVAEADALVTTRDDVALGVLVADCVPVLLADPSAGVVAAVHAGRRGVVDGVVGAALDVLGRAGASPRRLVAVIGPAACGRCYEVPAELQAEVAARVPGVLSTTSWGTPALDLPGAVGEALCARGVGSVRSLGCCTLEDARWYSHRAVTGGRPVAARPAGRLAAVVRLAASAHADRVS